MCFFHPETHSGALILTKMKSFKLIILHNNFDTFAAIFQTKPFLV